MQRNPKTIQGFGLLFLLMTALVSEPTGTWAADTRPAGRAPGIVVAIVNTDAVLKDSKKYGPQLADLVVTEGNIRIASQREDRERSEALTKLRTLEKGSDEAKELQKKIQELTQASVQRGEASSAIKERRQEIQIEFMEEFTAAIKTVSTKQGIDLVIRKEGSIAASAVLSRQILFYSERIDITAQVLKVLNESPEAK